MRRDMTLSQYCAWWRQRDASGARSSSGGGESGPADEGAVSSGGAEGLQHAAPSAGAEATASGGPEPLLYLKDWHFASEHPHYKARGIIVKSRCRVTHRLDRSCIRCPHLHNAGRRPVVVAPGV